MAMTTVLVLVAGSLVGQPAPTPGRAPETRPPGVAPPVDADRAQALRLAPGLRVASAYGFAAWDQVEQIEFTFNAKLPDREEPVVRRWTWRPKAGEVTQHLTDGEPIDFSLIPGTSSLPVGNRHPQTTIDAHKAFINDHYWLLFPFQLVWSNPTITEHGKQPLPIPRNGEGAGEKLTVQYGNAGGYTPGDAYDLYLGEDGRIVQWVYRKSGVPADQGRPATWEGNTPLGPITVATEHNGPGGPDGKFRLWFTGLKVTVKDAQGQTAVHEPAPPDAPADAALEGKE